MFVRRWVCLEMAHLPVPKSLAAKPCVSITSKVIGNTRLQVLYFGHLRKTGGRGMYRLIHTSNHPVRKGPPPTPVFPTLPAAPLPNLFFSIMCGPWAQWVCSYLCSFPDSTASE